MKSARAELAPLEIGDGGGGVGKGEGEGGGGVGDGVGLGEDEEDAPLKGGVGAIFPKFPSCTNFTASAMTTPSAPCAERVTFPRVPLLNVNVPRKFHLP